MRHFDKYFLPLSRQIRIVMENEIQTETQPEVKTTNCEAINVIKCLNCGTEFEGKYCPECGQSAEAGRFTLKFIFSNLLAAIVSRDGGIGYTIKNLFTRPSQMIVDILDGKRRKYVSPFPTLFLALTLYVLVFTTTGSKNIELPEDWETELADTTNTNEQVQFSVNVDDKTLKLNGDVTVKDQTVMNVSELAVKWYKFYLNHYTLCYMLTLPLFVIAARCCYGKQNRKRYYWAEYTVAMVYAMVFLVLYRCIINLIYPFSPDFFEKMAFFEPVAIIIALTACFRKMLGFSTIKTVWRSILTTGLYYLLIGTIALVAIIAFTIFFVVKYMD